VSTNIDQQTVEDFGREWKQFDQSTLSPAEHRRLFEGYFRIFPWRELPRGASGFDAGCGSGRWAKLVAPRVGVLHCIDASRAALEVAERNLRELKNCRFHCASIGELPLEDGSMDFGYSLGVLHHMPETEAGLASCVRKLKPGAPFLLYLYYAFDNRSRLFRSIWRVSDLARRGIARLPFPLKYGLTQLIAGAVYYPAARAALVAERAGMRVDALPLSIYRHHSFYVMRTDALDRFGTRLERRFTRAQIGRMMEGAGLERISFSPEAPYWCAVGYRRTD
jgi:SAM-dependent methyltransferase